MNFLDALQLLENGECTGIYHSDWTQKHAPQILIIEKGWLAWSTGCKFTGFNIPQIFSDCWEVVNRKQKKERIDVKRWVSVAPSGHIEGFYTDHHQAVAAGSAYCEVYELCGAYERPIKPKVKRREISGTFYSGYDAHKIEGDKGIPDNALLIFEWEE